MIRRTSAFTLLELMAVVTLLAVFSSILMFNVDGLTSRTVLRSTGMRIGTMYRLAMMRAEESGLPQRVSFSSKGYTMSHPVQGDEQMSWSQSPMFTLGQKMSIVAVDSQDSDLCLAMAQDPIRSIVIQPHLFDIDHTMVLESKSGSRALLLIDGFTGETTMKYCYDTVDQ